MPYKTLATITDIEYSPSTLVTFVHCKPEEEFAFVEGQFIMVSSVFDHQELGKPLKKAYSIATTQQELAEQGTIGFIVKKTREGFMSEYLTEGIKVGDKLHIDGSYGHMIDKKTHPRYLLISTGSGISPILGIFNYLVAKHQDASDSEHHIAKIAMLYGERYTEHMPQSIVDMFSKNFGENVKTQLFLSKDEIAGVSKSGHIQAGLDEALDFLDGIQHKEEVVVYICGKPEMVDNVRGILTEKGFERGQILFEKY